MSSIPSLGRMVSGLISSQKGLQVTGHNISNINTPGYTRQQVLQHDSKYSNISGASGLKQVGQGVSITEVRQIRDELADKRLRSENSILNFYTVKQSAISEVEGILGEPHGASLSKMLDDFWKQTQKLGTNPSGIEERLAFLQTADVLMKKANHMMEGLNTYQDGLNKEVIESVDRINTLLHSIKEYNDVIVSKEMNGDIAHDLRDQRNLLLDELSSYMEIDYYEEADGRVTVRAEGREVVDGQFVTELDLKQTKPGSSFLKPIWKHTGEDVYRLDREVNSARENDSGRLHALLIARGDAPANATTSWDEIALNDSKSVSVNGNAFMIPKMQKELSMFIQELAKVVNDSLDGLGTGAHADEMGIPIFVPIASIDGSPLPIQPNRADYTTAAAYNTAMQQYFVDIEPHLVGGNVKVNPALLADDGYNKLGTVTTQGNIGDNTKITELLDRWSESREWPPGGKIGSTDPYSKKTNFMDFYAEFVAEIGREGFETKGKVKEKNTTVMNIENERLSMGGVSQDEELANMIKYQHSYNASSRMITVLDDMLDTIINKM